MKWIKLFFNRYTPAYCWHLQYGQSMKHDRLAIIMQTKVNHDVIVPAALEETCFLNSFSWCWQSVKSPWQNLSIQDFLLFFATDDNRGDLLQSDISTLASLRSQF